MHQCNSGIVTRQPLLNGLKTAEVEKETEKEYLNLKGMKDSEKKGEIIKNCELFFCDHKSKHCAFINNATIAYDTKLDCYHQTIKIYMTIYDRCEKVNFDTYSFIPSHIGTNTTSITEVVSEPKETKYCVDIIKYIFIQYFKLISLINFFLRYKVNRFDYLVKIHGETFITPIVGSEDHIDDVLYHRHYQIYIKIKIIKIFDDIRFNFYFQSILVIIFLSKSLYSS